MKKLSAQEFKEKYGDEGMSQFYGTEDTGPDTSVGFAGTKFLGEGLGLLAEHENIRSASQEGDAIQQELDKRLSDGRLTKERHAKLSEELQPDISNVVPKRTTGDVVRGGIKAGTDIASLTIGGGGAANIAKATTGGRIIQGAGQGFRTGLGGGMLSGFGQGVEENRGVGNTIKKTTIGGAVGAGAGLVLGGGLPAALNPRAAARAISKTADAIEEIPGAVVRTAAEATQNAPSSIMNRVARLNPTDEIKFKNISGKSPGEYLAETGNFGSPDDIIANEAKKFAQSINDVDDAFAKLPGEYQYAPLADALELLVDKGQKVSTENVPARFAGRAKELLAKHNSKGLNMEEINEVKRLFEREVKLGYNKMLNPDLVQKATNIDSTIRQWQVSKADYLGFKNIGEMNKQTQISKFLVNKLGDKIIGQLPNNAMTLTDWIMISGGDPTAVGGLIVKKLFSSKAVQARIAKMLNSWKVQGPITPDMSLTPEYLNQKALPEGIKIPGQYPIQGRSVPAAPTTFEAPAGQSTRTRINPKNQTMYIRDLKTGKMRIVPKD